MLSCTAADIRHILMYMPDPNRRLKTTSGARKAKIFMNNRSQAVRLPKDFQFNTEEVFIRKEGSDVVLSPRPSDWSSYLAEATAEDPGQRRVYLCDRQVGAFVWD